MIVVKSKVKEFVKNLKVSIGADVYDKLEEVVGDIIVKATQRTIANKRKTLRARDL